MQPLYLDWDLDDRRKAIDYLPLFEDQTFVPCTWVKPEPKVENGKTIHSLGWPEYDPRIYQFFDLAWNTPDIDPYVGDPWDQFWARCWTGPIYFENATVGEIRRFLMLVKRRERFGDGTIDAAFQKGLILAALRRLKELTPG